MKRCQRCDLNFPDNLRFCEACGGALAEVATVRCPACGEAVQPGWKFCAKCRSPLSSSATSELPRDTQRPSLPPTVPLVSSEISSTAPLRAEETTRSSQQPTISDTQIRVRCRSCRNLVDEDSEFCEFCGASMFADTMPLQPAPPQPTVPQSTRSQQGYTTPDRYQDNYRPAQAPRQEIQRPQPPPSASQPSPDKTPPTLSMLSSYGVQEDSPPSSFRWWHGLILFLFFLVFVGALGAGGWWWWSSRSSTAQSQVQPSSNPNQSTQPSTSSAPTPASQRNSGQVTSQSSVDADLKRLHERVSTAKPSDSEILTSIKAEEEKYSTDYRFTYERAKLFGKGLISHDEAFDALYEAAEKAIDNGKAQEMLDDMTANKDGDFYRLSRGHRDWGLIMQALSNKDKAALKGHIH